MKFLFRPFKKGFEHTLGELENEVMQFIWNENNEVSAKIVYESISKKRNIALTTIFTILDRLTKKGILLKEKKGKTIIYKPKITREHYIEEVTRKTLQGLLEFSRENVISCFVDIVSNSDDLEKIKKLISKKIKNC
jgi:predicted transcriptional regulator